MSDITQELNEELKAGWKIQTVPGMNEEQLHQLLATEINRLIQENFSWLVHLLYRMDISEKKIRSLLREYPDNSAGSIIARLVIERQKQKLIYKKEHPPESDNISDEEKW